MISMVLKLSMHRDGCDTGLCLLLYMCKMYIIVHVGVVHTCMCTGCYLSSYFDSELLNSPSILNITKQ